MEADFVTALRSVCPNVHATVAPTNTPKPYVTWQQYGGVELAYVGNDDADARNAHIQVDVWADDPQEAIDLIRAIAKALRSAEPFSAAPMAAHASDYDPDMQVYNTRQDFNVWA